MEEFDSEILIGKYLERLALQKYLTEVKQANKNFNLYSRNLETDALRLMVAESLIPLELGWVDQRGENILDIGSGWGIPAVPLLMACSNLGITLAERSEKKADFLRLLLRRLKMEAEVKHRDLKGLEKSKKYTLFTMRRVAVDEKLAGSIRRIASKNARLIYFGPGLPENLYPSRQVIDYRMDCLPERRLARADIFFKK